VPLRVEGRGVYDRSTRRWRHLDLGATKRSLEAENASSRRSALWACALSHPAGQRVLRPGVPGACDQLDVTQSMGRPGSALDNAVIESWHSTLEFELRRVENFPTTTEARRRVAALIHDYNRDNRHSSIGMIFPIAYERSPDPEATA
jgi:transposase InsO family protein